MSSQSDLDRAIGPDPRGPLLTNEEFEAAMKKVKKQEMPWERKRELDIDDDDRDWESFAGISSYRFGRD